ncbi:MAG: CHASE domain-containing protein [Ignavibacteriaceae bacterium]
MHLALQIFIRQYYERLNALRISKKDNELNSSITEVRKPGVSTSITISFLVFLTCLVIIYFILNVASTNRENELRSYFDYRSENITTGINHRIIDYEQILRSTQGLFEVSDKVNRAKFRTFYNTLHLNKNFPGIQGVGFSLIIAPALLKDNIKRIHQEGFPNYKIWPEGKRETYTSIIYLEPFRVLNLRAFGYDMYTEPVRRKAMETARDSNEPVISGKVKLVQETGKAVQAGFLMYLPVYKNGTPHTTLSDRRKNIIGWVYSPFRMGDFMEGLFGEHASDLHIEIYDGKNISNKTKMFDSDDQTLLIGEQLTLKKESNLNGHEWTVFVRSTPQLESRIGINPARIILIVGISLSLLLAIITWLLVNKRLRTIAANNERKQAEEKIKKNNKELIKLNAEKDKFFSIIAHDLKSPFSGFLNLTELMADSKEKYSLDEFAAYSKSLNESARHLYKLLENLLEWAQIQKGSISFIPKGFNLSTIVMQNIEIIRQRALQKKITIINEVPAAIIVYADEKMIDTVLRNLLSNAVKFTRADGKVIVKSELSNDDTLTVSVSDNGVGIPEDDLKRLFKIEEKVNSQGTDGELSTGLGLLLCKEFVEKNGGKIWVESKENVGSTFYFTLPKVN